MPASLPPPPFVLPNTAPYCHDQVSIRFLRGAEDPAGTGSTHRTLALHNVSAADCEIDARPSLEFRGVDGRPLSTGPITGFGGHGIYTGHGGVMPLVLIPAGRTAVTTLSWTDVGAICLDVQTVTIKDAMTAKQDRSADHGLMMQVRMCGDHVDYVDYKQPFLALEPIDQGPEDPASARGGARAPRPGP